MDFREATDSLFARLDHEDLAKRLGVSVASIRQARLKPEAGAHRSPPANWQATVLHLAEERVRHYRNLITELRCVEANEAVESTRPHSEEPRGRTQVTQYRIKRDRT